MVTPLLRVAGSVGLLVGSAWLAVNWLDQRLTTRIIASTDEAMRDPTVRQEVDALLTRTAHRLLAEPDTEKKIAEFLTEVATDAEMQEGSLHILAGTLLSDQFKKAGVEIMKELAVLVLTDTQMRAKLAGISHGIAAGLVEAAELQRLPESVNMKMPRIPVTQGYEEPKADFETALRHMKNRLRREQIKDQIESLRVTVHVPTLPLTDFVVFSPSPQFQY